MRNSSGKESSYARPLKIGALVLGLTLLSVLGIAWVARSGAQPDVAADVPPPDTLTTSASASPTSTTPSATEERTPRRMTKEERREQREWARDLRAKVEKQAKVDVDKCRVKDVTTAITVVSYNIKSGRVPGGLAPFVGILQAADPDIVILQEVDKFRDGTGHIDQAGWLADRLGMEDSFGANVYSGGASQYGTAILSRFPILATENTHLPNGPGGQQRGLLKTVVDVAGVPLSVYSTHLQNRIDYLKMRQIQAIVPIVDADENPLVLGGDFNSHPGSGVITHARSAMKDTWDAVGVGAGLTHPSSNLRGRIDFVFYAHDGIVPRSAVVLSATNSDHRAIRATYEVTGSVDPCPED